MSDQARTAPDNGSSATPRDRLGALLAPFAGKNRASLLPCLLAVQQAHGWLSPDRVERISATLNVPVADIYGVIDFYAMLYRAPQGQHLVRVCDDVSCYLAHPFNSEALLDAIGKASGLREHGATSPDGAFTLERMPCLGRCEHAPVMMIDETAYGSLSPDTAVALLASTSQPDSAQSPPPVWRGRPSRVGGDLAIATYVGRIDPTDLADYGSRGGWRALHKALSDMSPQEVVKQVEDSGLVGRGGAAFPTGVKWRGAAAMKATPKMVVCNADESETGTFKDRILLEGDPYRVIEGMILCAYAIQGRGDVGGYLYVRGEYAHLPALLERCLAACRAAGYLGPNILGSGLNFDIELRVGAGAYICGEETALFESIEGYRGMPRVKPPFPTEAGLFGKPTAINNVETLCNIPSIIFEGHGWLRRRGTAQSPGSKLFCVSGRVRYPGLYELPLGRSLRHLVVEQAGGPLPGRQITAVLMGGAAGTFVGATHFDVALDWQSLREIGATLGSGAVMVLDDTVDRWAVLSRISHFFAHESCGKCYPCQMGTQRQMEIVDRIRLHGARPGDRHDLDDLAGAMRDASLCGLGQTASGALLSAIDLWGL